ncbi:MAG: DUF2971 domain-containing protein [Verrucomicrobiia bacterium]
MAETESGNPNRLYRFLRAVHAKQAIETKRLRVGRLAELNDPFELRPAILGLPEDASPEMIDKHERVGIDRLNGLAGILCFCKTISDPAVWTHYGDEHRGVALGFDYPSLEQKVKYGDVTKVCYPASELRPQIDYRVLSHVSDEDNDKLGQTLLSRKAKSWQYEQEYRIFAPLNLFKDGMYWQQLPKDLLVLVVLGILCPDSDDDFTKLLRNNGFEHTEVRRAKLSRMKYEVEI